MLCILIEYEQQQKPNEKVMKNMENKNSNNEIQWVFHVFGIFVLRTAIFFPPAKVHSKQSYSECIFQMEHEMRAKSRMSSRFQKDSNHFHEVRKLLGNSDQ